jgi:hypothetical protein
MGTPNFWWVPRNESRSYGIQRSHAERYSYSYSDLDSDADSNSDTDTTNTNTNTSASPPSGELATPQGFVGTNLALR